MWYPKWVYHYREDLTRENMRKYEEMKDEFYKKCEEICPDFWDIDLRSRLKYKALIVFTLIFMCVILCLFVFK